MWLGCLGRLNTCSILLAFKIIDHNLKPYALFIVWGGNHGSRISNLFDFVVCLDECFGVVGHPRGSPRDLQSVICGWQGLMHTKSLVGLWNTIVFCVVL